MLKILWIVELRGIYKNAAHRYAIVRFRFLYKRQVPVVKGSHSRYKANRYCFRVLLCQVFAEVFLFPDNKHKDYKSSNYNEFKAYVRQKSLPLRTLYISLILT